MFFLKKELVTLRREKSILGVWAVVGEHVRDAGGHLVAEPLGLEYFHFFAVPQQFLLEIEGGPQEVGEDAVLVGALHLALRGVNLEVADVVGLVGRDLDFHHLLIIIGVVQHPDKAIEVGIGIPVTGHAEGGLGLAHRQDAVERANPDGAVLFGAAHHQIPPLAEQLHA